MYLTREYHGDIAGKFSGVSGPPYVVVADYIDFERMFGNFWKSYISFTVESESTWQGGKFSNPRKRRMIVTKSSGASGPHYRIAGDQMDLAGNFLILGGIYEIPL